MIEGLIKSKNKCFEEHKGEDGKCHGLYGGDRFTDYLSYGCIGCKHLDLIVRNKKEGKKSMELKDTINLMNSDDFKDRFVAEYLQTKIRYEKLHKMIIKYRAGTLKFEPKCEIELFEEQAKHMGLYLKCLEIRAEIEGIEL